MRNVKRGPMPASLAKNADRWTKELLAEVARAASSDERVPESFYNKYNKQDVRDALSIMYGRRCCYCEASVAVVTKGHIEHRRPKRGRSAFPEHTYDWDNLHLACPECNQAKREKWDAAHAILDAVHDKPITRHLSYDVNAEGVWRKALSKRGGTTESHAKLNRDDLVKHARVRIVLATWGILDTIKRLGKSPRARVTKLTLAAMKEGDYGSLVGWAIRKHPRR